MPTAVVLGASGFSGGELLRLLARHPDLAVVAASAAAGVGAPVAAVHPHLAALDGVLVSVQEACSVRADVLFSCLPHGELARHIEGIEAPLVVDLADDFRADQGWVYGLTEFVRPSLAGARRVANPGCYPTATLLAVVPFAREKLVSGPVVVDAISGTSGAGRKPSEKLSLAAAEASVTSYGSVSHRHVAEIERGLCAFGGLDAPISFTPHLAPMSRGLLATVRARLDAPLSDDAATEVLRAAYAGEDFVEVLDDWPATKATTGSNAAHVAARIDDRSGWLVCSGALDNLGKGAAGQALQNANLALGLPEGEGLEAAGVWP